MLPSECPNCGRLHPGHNFIIEPGPVQQHLLALARAALRLVGEYEEDRSDSHSDAVNSALSEAEDAGLIAVEAVVSTGILNTSSRKEGEVEGG